MPKFLLHVPVSGALDIIVEAETPEDVIENYFHNEDSLLRFHGNRLYADHEGIQIVIASDHNIC